MECVPRDQKNHTFANDPHFNGRHRRRHRRRYPTDRLNDQLDRWNLHAQFDENKFSVVVAVVAAFVHVQKFVSVSISECNHAIDDRIIFYIFFFQFLLRTFFLVRSELL